MRLSASVIAAVFCALCIAVLPGPASAGCGGCGGYAPGQVFYAAPTYSYAPPTVTVVPHYIVQPNVVVQRTYVVRPTEYVHEGVGCSPCGGFGYGAGGYVVNQGQYSEQPAFYPGVSVGFRSYYGAPHYRYGHYHRYAHYSHWRRYRAHW